MLNMCSYLSANLPVFISGNNWPFVNVFLYGCVSVCLSLCVFSVHVSICFHVCDFSVFVVVLALLHICVTVYVRVW